jgi:hypothetical protein
MAPLIIAKPILHGSATKFAGFLVAWRPWLEPAWQYFAILEINHPNKINPLNILLILQGPNKL